MPFPTACRLLNAGLIGLALSSACHSATLPITDIKLTPGFSIAKGLRSPNGVAFRDGALYVAEINRILRFDNIETQLRAPPVAIVVNASFPDKSHHGWKFIRFGPDGKAGAIYRISYWE